MKGAIDVVDIEHDAALSHAWDAYVVAHPGAAIYLQSSWRDVIHRAYGHNCYYLMALNEKGHVRGVLPLVHMKSFLFGNRLTSMPFFDMGGALGEDEGVEKKLLSKAISLAEILKVDQLELRQTQSLKWFEGLGGDGSIRLPGKSPYFATSETNTQKVRMLLDLPESSECLMKSFKSKLRSQVRKPMKEGCTVTLGADELIDAFYEIFAVNMRDLGSPVHSKRMIEEVFKNYPGDAKVAIVYKDDTPVAGSIMLGFGGTLSNPWSSSLRRFSKVSPNMLLYWAMLEYACDQGYKHFDFGRSTLGEGTWRFKEQWGATPHPLHWHQLSRQKVGDGSLPDKSSFDRAIHYWQKLPVSVTKIIGPMIRRHIAL